MENIVRIFGNKKGEIFNKANQVLIHEPETNVKQSFSCSTVLDQTENNQSLAIAFQTPIFNFIDNKP